MIWIGGFFSIGYIIGVFKIFNVRFEEIFNVLMYWGFNCIYLYKIWMIYFFICIIISGVYISYLYVY